MTRNTTRDVNVNRDITVNRDVDVDRHYYYGYGVEHPVERAAATAAVIGTAAAVTAAAIGSVVATLPADCITTVVNGFAYRQCGSVWYQPQYSGADVTYIVVSQP